MIKTIVKAEIFGLYNGFMFVKRLSSLEPLWLLLCHIRAAKYAKRHAFFDGKRVCC